MKKLSFILFLSFALIGHANAHSGRTDSKGGHNDYSNGTYHYHNSGNNKTSVMDYGSYQCSGLFAVPYNENQPGYTPCPAIQAYEANYELGTAIMEIFQAVGEGITNDKTSKTKSYSAPVINNSLRNTPFYNFGTTYQRDKDKLSGSDGIRCSFIVNSNDFSCNNGVNYYVSDTGIAAFGSDGTSYKSNWGNSSDDNYYCTTSSFGSKCCGSNESKTCSSTNNMPDNAYATSSGWECNNGYLKILDGCKKISNQSSYTSKKTDNSKANNQTTSSTPKSKQYTFGFSGLSDFLGFVFGLSFLGLILWWVFKDFIKSLISKK